MQTGHIFMAVKYFKKAAASMPASVYFANLAQALWSVGEVCLPFCGDCGCNPHTPRNADRRGYPRAADNSPHRRDAGCSFIHRKPLTAVPPPLDDHVCVESIGATAALQTAGAPYARKDVEHGHQRCP